MQMPKCIYKSCQVGDIFLVDRTVVNDPKVCHDPIVVFAMPLSQVTIYSENFGPFYFRHFAPLLADIFLYSYEAEFIQSLRSAGRKRLASQFNFTYIYIDDVLSINN